MSLSERAYQQILSDIVEGRLAPGSILDRGVLAKRLGMSTIPVLEALRRLETDGMVESRPRWPARVKVQDSEFIRGEYILREALETHAARLCAENASDDQLHELADLGRQVDRLLSARVPNSEDGPRMHLEFHMSLARLGGGAALVKELEMMNLRLIIRRNWTRAVRISQPTEGHQEVVIAIASRNLLEAAEAMRVHVRRGLTDELAALKSIGL